MTPTTSFTSSSTRRETVSKDGRNSRRWFTSWGVLTEHLPQLWVSPTLLRAILLRSDGGGGETPRPEILEQRTVENGTTDQGFENTHYEYVLDRGREADRRG